MSANSFFMTGSDRSRLRASSYEKGADDASYERAGAADAPGAAGAHRGPLARLAAAALIAAATVLAGCGSLPRNVGKTDSLALPPNPESPLVKIAKVSSPSPEQTGVRLLPLGAYSLDTRIQLAQRASTSSTTCSRTTRPGAC
jgi:hypothetical protein